jgi:hypothetical protein
MEDLVPTSSYNLNRPLGCTNITQVFIAAYYGLEPYNKKMATATEL